MANIRSPSCGCTTAFVSILMGEVRQRRAWDTRITKVGQTNIDELLLDFFWRRVNFLLSPCAFRRRRADGGTLAVQAIRWRI
ncbi:hypothetical protein MES5069_770021 [Mesorhizobium escarrei]|uniref:Uncharacterized protein n=1 Tax=Mesorhizobium escarrei TaxID=666018 RepID=A0ABM9EJS4_9HYPH|nr:hypothetical protein MES5069_770021 [Mesorhizobium escarrei]